MRVLSALGIALSLATAVAAQEETRRHSSDDSKYSFAVPANWEIGPLDGKCVFAFKLVLPGKRRRTVEVYVHRVESARNALARVHFDRPFFLEGHEDSDLKLGTDPVPYVEYTGDAKSDRPYRVLRTYSVHQRVGFAVEIVTTAVADWPAMRGALVRLACSFDAKIPEWPPRPKGFAEVIKDGYVYFLQPGVKKAHIARMAKIFKKVEREFASRYGPVMKDPSNAGQVAVYKAELHLPVCNDTGFVVNLSEGRIYSIPLPRDKTLDFKFAEVAMGLLFAQRFSGKVPWWLLRAEQMAMRARFRTGRRHPAIDIGLLNKLPRQLRKFDVVAKDADELGFEAFVYYSLLRSGPKKYREAFKAYLAGVASHEWKTLYEDHLQPLDLDEMRDAAQKFRRIGFKLVK